MKWCRAVRIAEEVQTLCERAIMLRYTYNACLVMCEGMVKGYNNNPRPEYSLKPSVRLKQCVCHIVSRGNNFQQLMN